MCSVAGVSGHPAQSGNDRYSTEIVADEMQMLGGRSGSGAPAMRDAGSVPETPPPPQTGGDDFDDDIPF